MKAIVALLVGLLSSGVLSATDTCESDVGGTFKSTNIPELAPYNNIACNGCREINHFPQDIRNFMWNWVVLGRGGTLTPGTNGLGRYIFGLRLTPDVVAWPVTSDGPDSSMSIPVCNDHGQCATGTINVEHNITGIRFARGWYVGINTGVKRINVIVDLPNGEQRRIAYSGSQMRQQQATAGYKLPVPYNTQADSAKSDDCLNNLGQKRPPDSEMIPVNQSGGGNGEGGDDPYARWWEEEEAYGGRVPQLRCGISSVSGGGSTRTCGWFWP